MKQQEYIDANKEAWDEAASVHARITMDKLLESYSNPDFNYLEEEEIEHLKELEITDKDVAQIGCNNGRELISIKRLGANRCVGFDVSEEFLKQAQLLNSAAGTGCEFVLSNVYEIDESYFHCFDFIYISVGVLHWMPDIERFFEVLAQLLRSEGIVYICETHPIIEMIEDGNQDDPVVWAYSYFDKGPVADDKGLDYHSNQEYDSKTMYSFHHTLSEIFNAAISNGLYIDEFVESPEHITGSWYNVEKQGPELPMSYVLVLEKDVD